MSDTELRVPMRSFVIVGQSASASPDFRLDDLPSTSGRLDVLLRCVRAALLVSHGLRRDVRVYLVLGGGEPASRVLRIDGASAKFVRPDERSLATLIQKTLATPINVASSAFQEVRPGVSLACGGMRRVIEAVAGATLFVLDEQGPDLRRAQVTSNDVAFFIGDHVGFAAETRAELGMLGALPISVGPLSLHSDDVVTLVNNELDRRREVSEI
jgi:tRNA (pseudouridine54-N1)-methyltransferase